VAVKPKSRKGKAAAEAEVASEAGAEHATGGNDVSDESDTAADVPEESADSHPPESAESSEPAAEALDTPPAEEPNS
jgi:hypothetical protein